MNKPLALLLSLLSIAWLVACGIALSYQNLLWAGLFIVFFVLQTGLGFVLKARLRRKSTP